MTPTARALATCRKRGWEAGVVERFNTFTKRRHDFLGVIDLIAVTGTGVLGIQVTSGSNHASRIAKAKAEPRLTRWLASGARFSVWSWSRKGPRGKRKLWTLREEEVTL